jgi:flagellar basal body L-ring protein FlgH
MDTGTAPDVIGTGASCSSPYEFQALHSGHRPSHFGDWLPHSLQEKTAAFFAKSRDCSEAVQVHRV